jgi:hypothetical protein
MPLFAIEQGMPAIIFKAQPAPAGKRHGRSNSVTYEIYHNLPDRWGNKYPDKSKCWITVATKASANTTTTIDYLDNVYLPEVGALERDPTLPCALLLDAYKSHYAAEVKAITEPMELLNWLLMDGGITPKAQPLDVLINKVLKGLFRDRYEQWALHAPVNPTTGHPFAPSPELEKSSTLK